MIPSYADVLEQSRLFAQRAGTALAVFAAFWIASRILFAAIVRIVDREGSNSDLLELLGKTARIAVQVFGGITALGTAGIDVSALALDWA